MTKKGIDLTAETANMAWEEAKPLWQAASESFAQGAQGEVTVFQTSQGVSTTSIWASTEYQALLKNLNVIKINYVTIMPDGSASVITQSLE